MLGLTPTKICVAGTVSSFHASGNQSQILWCGCLTNHDIGSSFALEDDEYQLVGQRTPMISAVASTTLALTKKLFKFEHGP